MGDFKCREVKSRTDQCKLVLLGLSLAGNLVKPLIALYGTEWRERGYGFSKVAVYAPAEWADTLTLFHL
jgi:hypothetical protein